ncbi:TPA: DUF2591 family protein [Citrobacter amalonaticus]|nr:DUF2591 domain-containing protein [Citrobacter amalonaticus]HDT0316034.1 DUF2591 family protein [Citrobacter amalonaticus]
MDYSELSDYEVSKRVAMAVGGFLEEDFCETHSVIFRRHGRHQYSFFEPCTNPSDAWPIILENKISLNWAEVEKSWCAHVGGVMTDGCWCWDYDPEHHQDNVNPLRAAMIVFLMMQDSANVPANSTGSDLR